MLKENLLQEKMNNFESMELSFQDLVVYLPKKKQKKAIPILKGISSYIKKGSLTAIVGPSGSGKTTLLNYLSARFYKQADFHTSCEYQLNGTKIDSIENFKNVIGFVEQENLLET